MKTVYALENQTFRIGISPDSGAIESLFIKPLGEDFIGEKRLASAFRLRLQLPECNCNYSIENRPSRVSVDGGSLEIAYEDINTEKGVFPISLTLGVHLDGDEIRFTSKLINHSDFPVAEFWYPRLGGLTGFGGREDAEFFWPGYFGPHYTRYFTQIPTSLGFGSQFPEAVMGLQPWPWLGMSFFDLYNSKLDKGLYFGYHDEIHRVYLHHFYFHPRVGSKVEGDNWPTPDTVVGDDPIGIVYSHIRFPYVQDGETFNPGEFVLKLHDGDWHKAAPFYRQWYDSKFKVMEPSWLRRKTVWYSGLCLESEDRIVADYKEVVRRARDAKKFGIDTMEVLGWDKGGQDRDYPEYTPDERLGGENGFREMLEELDSEGIDPVIFGNYNAIAASSDLFKAKLHKLMRRDEYGLCENWMAWGQGTIQARTGLSVRRQVFASASCPEFQELIAEYFERLVRWGVKAMQIDKTGASEQLLDFNPLAGAKPDVAMPEGTVRAMEYLLDRCRAIDPDFCFASEAGSDRFLPFIDVFYRGPNEGGVSPMRYVFPEWTGCMHMSSPFDFALANAAVRFGCIIVIEPEMYTASTAHPLYASLMSYIAEVTRIREELKDLVFLSRWLDEEDAEIMCGSIPVSSRAVGSIGDTGGFASLVDGSSRKTSKSLAYSTHARFSDNQRAIVVVNSDTEDEHYTWRFTHREVDTAILYSPFEIPRQVVQGEQLRLAAHRFHIIVES